MSDLVSRLRMYANESCGGRVESDLTEAADRIEQLEALHTHLFNTIAHLPTFNAVAKDREVAAVQALKDYWLEVAAEVCEQEGARTDASWASCAAAIRGVKDDT